MVGRWLNGKLKSQVITLLKLKILVLQTKRNRIKLSKVDIEKQENVEIEFGPSNNSVEVVYICIDKPNNILLNVWKHRTLQIATTRLVIGFY